MNAGDIIVSIAANTASFIAEMDKVGQKISAFKSSIDQMGQSFLKGWEPRSGQVSKGARERSHRDEEGKREREAARQQHEQGCRDRSYCSWCSWSRFQRRCGN